MGRELMSEIMQIDVGWFYKTLRAILVLTVFFIIAKASRPPSEIHTEEGIINLIKSIGYGALAAFIYINVTNSGASKVDILTFFTFLLATFEAAHTFILTLGASIAMFLRSVFHHDYKGIK